MQYDVVKELEHHNITFERNSEKYLKVLCPFHKDEAPSGSLNVETGFFSCFACKHKTPFTKYLLKATGQKYTVQTLHVYLKNKYGSAKYKTIQPQVVDRDASIFSRCRFAQLIEENKCVPKELIEKHKLGYRRDPHTGEDCVTIPIEDEYGFYVNVRKYFPNHKPKFRNEKGRGEPRLFPIEQLEYDKVVICGGELKALAASVQLNKYGIGAVSPTCGEPNWEHSFNDYFRDKIVYVCYDIDAEGVNSMHNVCMFLYSYAAELYKIFLPLSIEDFPEGDITDFIYTGGDLYKLIQENDSDVIRKFEPYVPKIFIDMKETPKEMPLSEALDAMHIKQRIKTECIVSAIRTSPLNVPARVHITCDKSQKYCCACPIYLFQEMEFAIPTEAELLLDLLHTGKKGQPSVLKQGFGIPDKCSVVTFDTCGYYSIEDTKVSSKLDITSRQNDREMQQAYIVGGDIEMNESYDMIGRMYPHPITGESTLIFSHKEATRDALSEYKCLKPEILEVFQPKEWTLEGIRDKLNDIYEDIEANVTRIFKRRDLHLAIDLSYHSPLFMEFDSKSVKGWTEILIIGDSSQGKTEASNSLFKHYGVGDRIECKGVSVAGLMGGAYKIGDTWFAEWGVIPNQDKRHVILEELKGASVEVISKLTEMRSSGKAAITKIVKRSTTARTRLLAISNPRSNRTVASYNNGIEIVRELIGSLEDIRRFDFILLLSKDDINSDEVMTLRPSVKHTYTSELCKELILWTWTREAHQIQFENQSHILDMAKDLCQHFSDEVPIVDRNSMNLKLARLAAALAARTFSTLPDDKEVLYVRECHVEFVRDFIQKAYTSKAFKYDKFSAQTKDIDTLKNVDKIKDAILESNDPEALLAYFQTSNSITVSNLRMASGNLKEEAEQLLSILIRNHAVHIKGTNYFKTAQFTEFIEEMQRVGVVPQLPQYLRESEF